MYCHCYFILWEFHSVSIVQYLTIFNKIVIFFSDTLITYKLQFGVFYINKHNTLTFLNPISFFNKGIGILSEALDKDSTVFSPVIIMFTRILRTFPKPLELFQMVCFI